MRSEAGQWSRANYPAGIHGDSRALGRRSPLAHGPLDQIGQVALAIAVFLAGYNLLRVGPINLTLSDIAFLICSLVVIARGRLNLVPFGPLTPAWLLGLTLMLGGLFVSTIINGDPMRWIIVAGQYLAAFVLIPMVLMGEDVAPTRRLTVFYVLGITVSEIIGISASYLFSYQDTVGLMGDGFITGNGRLGAMTGEPNPNGAAVAFAMPMLIYAVRKKMMPMLLGVACAVPLIWGLLESASFTGFSALVIGVGIVMTISGLRLLLRLGFALAVGVALFMASGAPLPKAFQDRVAGAVSTGDLGQAGTFTDRAALIREAWQRAEDNVVIGVGVDRFREISPHGQPVHELHLLILNEGGGIAVMGLMLILALLLVLAVNAVLRNRDEGVMVLAVVAVFMIYTTSIPHMYSRQWVMPVMVALSAAYATRSLRPSRRRIQDAGEMKAVSQDISGGQAA